MLRIAAILLVLAVVGLAAWYALFAVVGSID